MRGVDVLDPPVEALGQGPAHRRLAGAHEPPQVDLVGPHARSSSSVSKNRGKGHGGDLGPVDGGGTGRAEGGDGEGHRQPVVVVGVDRAAGEATTATDDEAVDELVGVGAHGPEPRHERRDPVALLHPQLGGAADRAGAAEGRQRRQRRQFVDEQRHLGRRDDDVAQRAVGDPHRPYRLAVPFLVWCHAHVGAGPPQHVEQRRARGVEADLADLHRRPGQPARGHAEERTGRRIAGHAQGQTAGQARPPADGEASGNGAIEDDPERRQRPLGVIARRLRLDDRGRPRGAKTGQQDGALDLGARHFRRVCDAGQGPAADAERRPPALGGADVGPHRRQRRDHAAHRPPRERVVADQPRRETAPPPARRPAAASSSPSCRSRGRRQAR